MEATSEGAARLGEAPAPRRSRPWVRLALVTLAALFVGLLVYGVTAKAPETTIEDRLARGEATAAPGFDLPVLQEGRAPGAAAPPALERAEADGHVSLEELHGSPVVVNFWASWCDPCRAEADVLERGWRENAGAGTLFIGLDSQDLTGDAREFLAEFDTTYLNVRDGSDAVAREWGVAGLPETFFVSAEGEVVAHVTGAISADQLESGVEAAERGNPLGPLEGGERRSVR